MNVWAIERGRGGTIEVSDGFVDVDVDSPICDDHVGYPTVPGVKFPEREIFAFSRFQFHNAKMIIVSRSELHNANNLCLSYKIIQIKIKI
jgi:hypothetical protein